MADEQRDVIEVLEHDHREVEQMFAELESLRGAATEEALRQRKALTEQVTIELVRHSVAEEVLVYPEVEKKISAEEAEHAREEHAEAEETLQRLEKLDADDPAFDGELDTLVREIRHHIEEEEGETFAHMRQSMDPGGAARITWWPGRGVQEGRCRLGRIPTYRTRRSPGWQRDRRPLLFDRMRDLATGRGTDD